MPSAEEEVPPPEPTKSSKARALLPWLVGSALFAGIYRHVMGGWRFPRWDVAAGLVLGVIALPFFHLLLVFLVSFGVLLVGYLVYKLYCFPRDRLWARWTRKIIRLEARGQLAEACSRWKALARWMSPGSWAWGDVTLRQAWALLRGGQGRYAQQLLASVLSRGSDPEQWLAMSLGALALALEGLLPLAEAMVGTLENERVLHGVVGGLANQVLLLRRGEFSRALAYAVPPWDIADPECRHLRHVWALLRAFALEHLHPAPERDVERTRAELRGLRPEEMGYLTAQWPELQAFLDSRVATLAGASSAGGTSESPGSIGSWAFTRASFGLGLPESRDPESTAFAPLKALCTLVALGGFVALPFMSPLHGGLLFLLVLVLVFALFAGFPMPVTFELWLEGPVRQGREAHAGMRLEDARRIFEQVLEGWPQSDILFELACVYYKLGERSLARRLFHALSLFERNMSQLTCSHCSDLLAECEATEGNLGRARLWVERARRLGECRDSVSRELSAPLVLALREGNVVRGSMLAESRQRSSTCEHDRRQVELLQAFMLEGLEHPTPEQQEEYARLHARLREQVAPGEFDYLAPEWPELRAFLQRLGKARAA